MGFVVGRRGEGPGEFASPQSLFVEGDGSFWVREGSGSRFTYFTVEGDLEASVLGPGRRIGYQGFGIELAWPRNGVHLGTPLLPLDYELGLMGDHPVNSEPLLRVGTLGGGQWGDPEPLLWLDVRKRAFVLERGGGRRSFFAQPFGDADQVRLEPGTAVVMRTKGAPGVVELLEVDSDGDTIWHRHLQFEPHRLTARRVAETVNGYVAATADFHALMSRQQLRALYSEALYGPEYFPAADGQHVLAASGEVWIRTHELADTLRTHLCGAPRRHEPGASPRASTPLAAGPRRHRHPCLGRLARHDGRAARGGAKAGGAGSARIDRATTRCIPPMPIACSGMPITDSKACRSPWRRSQTTPPKSPRTA